jgi:heat-inducible transcriptional repressor
MSRVMSKQESSLGERRGDILKAIVSHYVRSGEPVGSKTLVDRYRLGVSSATVRNEMGALEEGGYIYQPHPSAGRVPTDAGYRYFVDAFADETKLPAPEARLIRRFFGEPRFELEDSLRETAALLSRLTDHAALVFLPALDRSIVRHLELVPLTGDRAMVVVVTTTGRVENHIFSTPGPLDDVHLADASEMLNRMIEGVELDKTGETIAQHLDRFPLELREIAQLVGTTLRDELRRHESERVFLEGTSNIVDEHKFADLETVRQVIGALEHRRLLLEVLAHGLASDRVAVRIGTENMLEEMQLCSIITAPYGAEGGVAGSLAVVGPTRMDYRRTVAAVHEVAVSLGQMLNDLGI